MLMRKRRPLLEEIAAAKESPDFNIPDLDEIPLQPPPSLASPRPSEIRFPNTSIDALPSPPSYAGERPNASAQPPRMPSADMEAQLSGMNRPLTRKQTLLQAVMSAAPIAAGAAFGGSVGASGAAQGVDQFNAQREDRQALQRKTLQQQIEEQKNREQQQMQSASSQAMEGRKMAEQQRQFEEQQATAKAGQQNQKDIAGIRAQSTADTAQSKLDLDLRKNRLKMTPQGIVPLDQSELTPKERAEDDYKAALTDHQQALADMARASSNPNSPQFKLAQQRAATTAARLDLSKQQFEMRAFGTNQGEALPGSMIADNGQAVGSSFQQNVRPTGTERNKGDLAGSAHDQIASMKDIVSKRKDIFGPINGRTTDFTVWVGSQDPDAQRFRAARTIAGDHLAGVFGGRSEAALAALDSAIGHFKDNPEAVMAGLDQLDQANSRFVKAGTVKTTGSDAAPKTGTTIKVISRDGVPGTIPFEDWPAAQKEGYKKAPK